MKRQYFINLMAAGAADLADASVRALAPEEGVGMNDE
ncbi:hypothetical protein ES703_04276 [subsurface metagenome]